MVGRFFEGSVVQAVQLSKGESKGLVVFLTGTLLKHGHHQ